MIEYINGRCNLWVKWSMTRLDAGLGYPHECAFIKIPGSPNHASPMDEAAWEIERAVRSLERDLNKAMIEFYLRRGTVDQKARACQCGRRTLFDRVHRAHCRIAEWLNDETAGVPHQVLKEISCTARTV